MSEPTVSVVIPAFRAAHTINRAIDSLMAQTRLADEIVVVDDGSPDDLAAALSAYGERVTLIRKVNGGASSAESGHRAVPGELVAFLDADDYWEPQETRETIGDPAGSSGGCAGCQPILLAATRAATVRDRFPILTSGTWTVLVAVGQKHSRSRRRSGRRRSSSGGRLWVSIALFRASSRPRIEISGFG